MRWLRNGAAYTAVVEILCGIQRGFLTWKRDEVVPEFDRSVRDVEERGTLGNANATRGSTMNMQAQTRSLDFDIAECEYRFVGE